MIITSNTASYGNLAPAHTRHGKKSHSASGDDANQTQTASTEDQSLVSNQNLISANPPLQDVDAALASLKSAQQAILGHPSMVLSAQAKSLPQSAVQLLQE